MKDRRLWLAVLIVALDRVALAVRGDVLGAAQQAASPKPSRRKSRARPTPAGGDSSTPVFKAETRLVLVDTIVTDKKGNYITDLTVKDFKVWEDNKEQPIKSFLGRIWLRGSF